MQINKQQNIQMHRPQQNYNKQTQQQSQYYGGQQGHYEQTQGHYNQPHSTHQQKGFEQGQYYQGVEYPQQMGGQFFGGVNYMNPQMQVYPNYGM